MALQKPITLQNGVTAEYWKLLQVSYFVNGGFSAVAGLYLNKAVRDAGADPVDSRSFTLNATKAEIEADNLFVVAYAKIKEQMPDAVDC